MTHTYYPAARAARRCPGLRAHYLLLLLALLLPWAARAQAPSVTVSPAGPLTLCAGTSQTLTATATVPGFNVAGTGFSGGGVFTVAVQADGKLLVGGEFSAYNGNAAAPDHLLRLNADGSLDNSFNPSGNGFNTYVQAVAVQADGKVLVGGEFSAYNGNAAAPDHLLRLNPDGSLDSSFNPGGTGFGLNNSVYAVTVQADGKLLVGGGFTAYNGNAAASDQLLRLNPDGSLDSSFNPGGSGFDFDGVVSTVAVQADGKLLVGGYFFEYNGNAAAPDNLLRLNADGSLDSSFNPGGDGLTNEDVKALAVQADGKVVVGGFFSYYNNTDTPNHLLRLNPDGSLDAAFNPGGSGFDSRFSASVQTVAVQADGKMLVGGYFTAYNGNNAAPDWLLRLNANGSLDSSFNPGGRGLNNAVYAVAVQADGKLLVGGYFTAYNGNAAAPDGLLRLNADGSLNDAATAPAGLAYTWSNGATGASITVSQPGDYRAVATTTSNGTGYSNLVRVNAPPAVTVQVSPAGPLVLAGGSSATLTATATVPGFNVAGTGFNGPVYAVVQADGKLLVGGDFTAYNGNGAAPYCLLRLHADGSLDSSFNPGGRGFDGPVQTVSVQADGKLLVGGDFTAYNGNGAAPDNLLRLNANGSLDSSFNPGGRGFDSPVYAVSVQADGKLLVGGDFTAYNGNAAVPYGLLRLHADGSLDSSFNSGGRGFNSSVYALAVQADGKLLVGGDFTAYNGNRAAPDGLLRLHADGSLDSSFNPNGNGLNNTVSVVSVQADGKLLVGGAFTAYNGNAAAPDGLLRLHADGSLDSSFNPNGNGLNNTVSVVSVQADGKLLVGGLFTAYNGNAAAPDRLLRINPDGSLDSSFNFGGTGFGGGLGGGAVRTVAVQADGKLLVGGDFTAYNGNAAAPDRLLRLHADGSLNDAATALAGATFIFTPGNTAGATRTVSTAGTYAAIATDPATGCSYRSNEVVVTVEAPMLTAVAPAIGGLGQTITLTGTALESPTALTINGANALAGIVSNTGTRLVVRVPVTAAASGEVSITTDGGTATVPFRVMPAPGNALAFDGVDDYVSGTNAQLPQGNAPRTLEAWVKPANTYCGLFIYGTNATNQRAGLSLVDNRLYYAGFNNDLIGATVLETDRWCHVAATFDGTTLRLYVNGVLDATQTNTYTTTGTNWRMGSTNLVDSTPDNQFRGRLDEVRVWNVARSVADVQADMRAVPALPLPAGVVAYYNFDQGAPAGPNAGLTTIYDLVSARPATLTGFDLSSGNTTSNYVESYALVVPTATAATNRQPNSFTATWTAPAVGTVTSYVLDVATDAAFTAPVTGSPFTVAAPATSYTVTGVRNGGAYYYRVRALNAPLVDQGAFSNTALVATPLPVELTAFTATAGDPQTVRLAWATASERNSARFEVERSLDGRTFQPIGTVPAAGTSSSRRTYSLPDQQLPAGATPLYYRLRQVDLDGTFAYSSVQVVTRAGQSRPTLTLTLAPNPTQGSTTLHGAAASTPVQVYDAVGRLVLTARTAADGSARLVLPAGLPTGVYVVRCGAQAARLVLE
ncbi:LamG-like jellyroll fold domain-containing protein [Hymenobacter yonginensis]|uniref:Fibronectin type III domain-containing protein n=1 Tax=Hymenobacter yonginensis TaxID=748197 RepID=A0ABY7PV56_9BACT|nr:LamG-like jellyroll fold domain-containing protein [Hymenobacter yonginensis]WBO86744.1 fibronectin type III domain-containing protein [Hymenobacter yonginensis]